MLLKGKNAVVTGSSRGLGKAIAEKFIVEGANVILCARDCQSLKETEKELSEKLSEDQKLYAFTVDISKPFSVKTFHYCVTEVFGDKVDILVNNAGIQGVKGLVDVKDIDEWINTININLIGVVHMSMIFLPQLKMSRNGKIINISGGGAANPRPYFSSYATSKAAVVRFTETLAEELREHNVDCNCIAPGALNTKMFEEALSAGIEKVGEKYYKQALKQKEDGGSSLENAAELCAFLASEKCNGITGKIISAIWDEWRDLPNHKQELRNTDAYTVRRILPSNINPYWLEKK